MGSQTIQIIVCWHTIKQGEASIPGLRNHTIATLIVGQGLAKNDEGVGMAAQNLPKKPRVHSLAYLNPKQGAAPLPVLE